MKNKMSDLRNYMFEAIERLSDEKLSPEELDREIKRAAAVSDAGKVIVDSAKTEVMYLKALGKRGSKMSGKFINEKEAEDFIEEPRKIEHPPAEYSNKNHLQIANTGS